MKKYIEMDLEVLFFQEEIVRTSIGAGENASLNEDPENGEVVENMPNFH